MSVSDSIDHTGEKLKTAAAGLSEKAAEVVRIAADEARSTVNEVAQARKHRAERYLNSVGAAIDAGRDKLVEDGLQETAYYARVAASSVRKISDEIEDADIGAATKRVEEFVRARPILSLGSALLLGFTAYQLLRFEPPAGNDGP